MPQDANNIYVGARYVPLLLGAWDASVQYQALSAVIYTDGNGYVSKRLVPAGTLPTDTDYWLLWGSGSVVIDQLSNRVGAVETRLDGLEARVTTNEGNITNIQAELLAHDSRLSSLEIGLSDANSEIISINRNITSLSNDIGDLNQTLTDAVSRISTLEDDSTRYKVVFGGLLTKSQMQNVPSPPDDLRVTFQDVDDFRQNVTGYRLVLPDSTNPAVLNLPAGYYALFISANIGYTGAALSTGEVRRVTIRKNNTPLYTFEVPTPERTDFVRSSFKIPELYLGEAINGTTFSIDYTGKTGDTLTATGTQNSTFLQFKVVQKLNVNLP